MRSDDERPGACRRCFFVADWLVEPSLDTISRGDRAVHLRPKVMDVLVFLAEHPGEVVSKETILEGVWAKQFIAESALSGAICELRDSFADDSRAPRFFETIPKRGYRLVAPVSIPGEEGTEAAGLEESPGSRLRRRVPVAALLMIGLAGATMISDRLIAPTSTAQQGVAPKIAVLQFENLGPAEDEYFAAGVTDEIASRLSGIAGLRVISRDSTRPYASLDRSLAEIGDELNADYLLLGAVRWNASSGRSHVRITPRLVRVADNVNLWADVYDRALEDIFLVQSDIARQVADQLNITLLGREQDVLASTPPTDPAAFEAYLRGRQYERNPEGEENQLMAVRLFERAVELDQTFSLGFSALARAHARLFHFGFDRSTERRELAVAACRRARELKPDVRAIDDDSCFWISYIDMQYAGVLTAVTEALLGHPNSSDLRSRRADLLRRVGRFQEALEEYLRAVEVNPRDAWLAAEVGVTRTAIGQYAEADRTLERSIVLSPDQHTAYQWKAHNALLWRRSPAAARVELTRMPPVPRASVVVEWWLVELCDGNYEKALQWLSMLPVDGSPTQSRFHSRDLLMAEVYRLIGDGTRARAAFEAARAALEEEARERPDDFRVQAALGVAYAGLGWRDKAVALGQRAVDLCPLSRDAVRGGFYLEALARIHVMTGDLEAAVPLVERLLTTIGQPESRPLIDIDPRWAPLRGHPRLAGLVPERFRRRVKD